MFVVFRFLQSLCKNVSTTGKQISGCYPAKNKDWEEYSISTLRTNFCNVRKCYFLLWSVAYGKVVARISNCRNTQSSIKSLNNYIEVVVCLVKNCLLIIIILPILKIFFALCRSSLNISAGGVALCMTSFWTWVFYVLKLHFGKQFCFCLLVTR
jgi:hypothetical protein